MNIPLQLQKEEYKFVKLKKNDKIPFEKDWQNNGYKFNDLSLIGWIDSGGNYGVIGGHGRLRILDIDDVSLVEGIAKVFKTFSVKTGKGGRHFYFLSDYDKNHVLGNGKGELRANNYQCVGSGSIHPNGNKYEIVNDTPLITITGKSLSLLLEPFFKFKKTDYSRVLKSELKQGERNDGYFKTACLMRFQNIPYEQAKEILYVVNEKSSKPLIQSELNQIIDSAYSYKNDKKETKTKINAAIGQFTDFLNMADKFLEIQPIFYDKSKIWFVWDHNTFSWSMMDEIDLMNLFDKAINNPQMTINSKTKNEIIEAIKRRARLKKPKEPGKTWIQFKDKIVDVKTGDIFCSTPEYFMTNPIPFSIGESDETPILDKLFREWVVGDGQDESYIKTLYEIIAYSTLKHQFLQRLFAFTGTGSNGKGVFQNIVTKFLGEENVATAEMKVLTKSNFASASLFHKQAVMIGEVDAYDMQNTNLLKQLTGEDRIRFEFKGKDSFTEQSYCTCFINTNSLPITPDKSDGFYRRWLQIEFPHQFETGTDILTTIPDKEFENLSRKIIKIIKELYEKKKFTNEGTIIERKRRYETKSNPIVGFLKEFCVDSVDDDLLFSDFYKKFQKYLKTNKIREITKKNVSKILREEGYIVKAKKINKDNWTVTNAFFIYDLSFRTLTDIKDIKGQVRIPMKVPTETLMSLMSVDVQEEFIEDSAEIIHQKCHICGCDPSTGYDKKGRPVCKSCALNLD